MKAYFCSEERYLRVIICFDTAAQKKMLCDTMDELLVKYDVKPVILIKRNESGGEVSIEFEDDYNEEAKPLIEEYASLVGLEFIDNCHVEAGECTHVGHID